LAVKGKGAATLTQQIWQSKKEGPHAPYTPTKTKEKLPANTKTNQHLKLILKREAATTRESRH